MLTNLPSEESNLPKVILQKVERAGCRFANEFACTALSLCCDSGDVTVLTASMLNCIHTGNYCIKLFESENDESPKKSQFLTIYFNKKIGALDQIRKTFTHPVQGPFYLA